MARSKKGEAAQRAAFLQALSETASITKACEISKLPRRTVYNWREADPHFAEAWDEALELGTDALEDEAIRRALHGTDKPVYQGGKRVGAVREFSDTLLIFMLKAKRPEKYKERVATEHSGPGGGPITHVTTNMTPQEAAEAYASTITGDG